MAQTTQAASQPSDRLKPIDPNPGSELDPANFVGRQGVNQRAAAMLAAKQNILLGDPRRMGKSFWIVAFADTMNRRGTWRVVRIDYQGVDTVEEFLRMTVEHLAKSQRLPERFLQYIGALFDNTEAKVALGPVTLKKAVRDSGTQPAHILENILIRLNDDIRADGQAAPLVIAMDEVADAVLSIAERDQMEAANLLRRLRHLRQVASHIRWIVAGSVGFHHVLGRCGVVEDVISDLSNLVFGPLDAADSAVLSRRLALGIHRPIDEAAIERMFTLTDGLPHLIQKLCDTMRFGDHAERLTSPITAAEVEERFEAFLGDRDQSRDVTQYVSRIDRYYGRDASTAFDILDWVTAGPPAGRPLAELPPSLGQRPEFARTLRNLVDDHYLENPGPGPDGRATWRYQVIRAIYLRRRGTRG